MDRAATTQVNPKLDLWIAVAHYDRYAREIIFFVPKVRPSEWNLRVFLPLIVKAMKVSLSFHIRGSPLTHPLLLFACLTLLLHPFTQAL